MMSKINQYRKFLLSLLIVISVFLVSAGELSAITYDISELENVPMPEFSEPKVTKGVLKNGMSYFFLEDHELPIVRVGVITKVGSIYDPDKKIGLASLTGKLIRTGGTKKLRSTEVDLMLDGLAANIASEIGEEMGTATLHILSSRFYDTLPVFFEMIFQPRFDETRIALGKLSIIEALKRENDYPSQLANRNFDELLYGKNSPWARIPTKSTLKNITREDIDNFHKQYFHPNNMILIAAGDFDENKLREMAESLTKNYPNEPVIFPEVASVEKSFKPKSLFIKKPLTQSYIGMGHLGIKRHNPDKYAIDVMNMILGGAPFKSRLMADIRTNRGLAYSISSYFSAGTVYGIFKVNVDTMAKNSNKVRELIIQHIKQMVEGKDISEEEVDFSKKTILNQLIFSFDNPYKIVSRAARFHFYGYPEDYLHIYRDNIEKITVEDVKRVSKEYLHPDGLTTVVVGP